MRFSAGEKIPDLSVVALDLPVFIGYDEAAAIREFAADDLFGALHFKQVHHGDTNSSCGGLLRFAAMGDYGTDSETPESRIGLRIKNELNPVAWQLSLETATALDSGRGSKDRTMYRIVTMNQQVWQAITFSRNIERTSEINIDEEGPSEEETWKRYHEAVALDTEGCINLLVLMDRAVRRAAAVPPPRKLTVKNDGRSFDLDNFDF